MAFENVNFGLLKPTVQLESPMDVAMKGTQLQGAQQQLQTGALQQQQLQKQIKDQQELQDTLRGAKTADDAMSKVQQLGSQASQGWMKNFVEMKQKGVQLSLEQSKLANEHLAKVGGGILSVANAPGATPQQVADYINGEAQAGRLDPNTLKDTLGTLPTDPAALPLWSKLQASKLGAAEHTLKLFTGDTKLEKTGTGLVPVTTNNLTGQVSLPQGDKPVLPTEGGAVSQDLNLYNSQFKDGAKVGPTDPGFIKWHNQMHPNMATVMGAAGGGGNFNPSEPLPDPGMEAVAQAIARGAQAPQEYSIRNPAGKIINARAAMIGGGGLQGKTEVAAHGADLSSFAAGGKNGQTINALNTMTEHLGTMEKAIGALNLGNIPLANKIGQAVGVQFGDDAPTNAQVIKGFLSGEVAKVATGGHLTEGEIGKAESSIKTAGSPAQAMGALGMMREIAGGKLTALNQDYQRITGKNLVEGGRLTPATAAAFKDVFAKQNGGNASTAPRITATQADGTKLQLSADGKSWEPMGVK